MKYPWAKLTMRMTPKIRFRPCAISRLETAQEKSVDRELQDGHGDLLGGLSLGYRLGSLAGASRIFGGQTSFCWPLIHCIRYDL